MVRIYILVEVFEITGKKLLITASTWNEPNGRIQRICSSEFNGKPKQTDVFRIDHEVVVRERDCREGYNTNDRLVLLHRKSTDHLNQEKKYKQYKQKIYFLFTPSM